MEPSSQVNNPNKWMQSQAIAIAFADLILANVALSLGKNALYYPNSTVTKWDLLSFNVVQLGQSSQLKSDTLEMMSLAVIFIGYILEVGLFILLYDAAEKRNGDKLRLWYHIRFVLYLVVSTIIVSHVAMLQGTLQVFIAQSFIGLLILLYRGCSLLIVTMLEEEILHSPARPPDRLDPPPSYAIASASTSCTS